MDIMSDVVDTCLALAQTPFQCFIHKLQMFGMFYVSELDTVDLKVLNGCRVKRGRFPSASCREGMGQLLQGLHGEHQKKLAEKHSFQEVMLSLFA